MSSLVQDAINALTTVGFVVETAGGRYTVAYRGDILLRQSTAQHFLIFAGGVAVGFDTATAMMRRERSLEQQLENSPAHQAALQGKDGK